MYFLDFNVQLLNFSVHGGFGDSDLSAQGIELSLDLGFLVVQALEVVFEGDDLLLSGGLPLSFPSCNGLSTCGVSLCR